MIAGAAHPEALAERNIRGGAVMVDWDGKSVDIPENLNVLLKEAVQKYGSKRFLIFEDGTEMTFEVFKSKVDRCANVLLDHGVRKGSIVGTMLPNLPLYPIVWYACMVLGAVVVPVNTSYRTEDSKYIINHSETSILVTTVELYEETIRLIRNDCPTLRDVLVVDGAAEGCSPLHKLMLAAGGEITYQEVSLNDTASIMFTSGTTGYPKGCMLDHAYWIYLSLKVIHFSRVTEEDRLLTAQPFYYMNPFWHVVVGLMTGAQAVIMNRFSPTRYWDALIKHQITVTVAIMIEVLHKTMPPGIRDKLNLRVVTFGYISPTLHREMEELTGAAWRSNYGLTETGVDLIVPLSAGEMSGSGTMGKPVWGREVRIVDDSGNDLEPGKVGEIILRGKGIFKGYYKSDEATAIAIRDGWFYSGDYGYQDDDGWFYFVGRKKDIIRRSSENISPMEVEDVLKGHPQIFDAAVIPVPDTTRGEEVKAYLILRDGETETTLTPQDVVAYCSEKLAKFKVPRYIEYRTGFPRTGVTGKVKKRELINEKSDLRQDSYDMVDGIFR
jgi:crotonobetaine/carnitine-CoA ligase